MSETEINLARGYLSLSGQDPVAALIRSVRDLARLRRVLLAGDREASDAELVSGVSRGDLDGGPQELSSQRRYCAA